MTMRPRRPDPREIDAANVAPQRAGWVWLSWVIVVVVLAAKLGLVSAAFGDTYVSVHGGASVWDCTSNSCEIEIRKPGGYRVQAALGRRLTDAWSAEAELSWQSHDIHGINPGDGRTFSGDGNTLRTVSLMGNALYDLGALGRMQPYVMAGAGVARQMVDGGGVRPLDGDVWTLAGQAGLGARYPLTDAFSLDARYVYWRALSSEIDAPDGLGNGLDLAHWSHNVMVGVMWEW